MAIGFKGGPLIDQQVVAAPSKDRLVLLFWLLPGASRLSSAPSPFLLRSGDNRVVVVFSPKMPTPLSPARLAH